MADKVWRHGRSGLMADTRETSSRDAARAYRGRPFFLREPDSKLFGEQHKADKWRTRTWGRGQSQQHKADTRRTQADKRPKPTTQGGHKADTRRTQGREVVDKWRTRTWRRGHNHQHRADKWRTHGGQAPETRPEHIATSLFS